MVFNDTSTNQGIIQEIESLLFSSDYTKVSGSTPLLQTFTRYCNQALDAVIPVVMEVDGTWQHNEATATDTLVNNQADYTISVAYLKMLSISIKQTDGHWKRLQQIDPQLIGIDRAELFTTSAIPLYYDIKGTTVTLYPAPNTTQVTASNGLKYYYQSTPSYFATSDTTKVPEIPSVFHRLIPLWASFFYCQANGITTKQSSIADEIKMLTDKLRTSYNERNVDIGKTLTARSNNSR